MGKKTTHKEFNNKVEKVFNGHMKLITKYTRLADIIEYSYTCDNENHNISKYHTKAKWIFNSGKSNFCKDCEMENRSRKARQRMSKEYYYKRLKDKAIERGGDLLTKQYTYSKDKYLFQCRDLSHMPFESTADDVTGVKNVWCPRCCGRVGEFEEEFGELVKNKNGKVLGKYVTSLIPVKVKCLEHDYIFEVSLCNLKKDRWCYVCHMPYSEKILYDYLKNNKIKFELQYTFENLRSCTDFSLRFDFAIIDNNGKLQSLIEVDDSEHRNQILANNKRADERRRIRANDRLKDKYCSENNIPLLRLEFNSYKKQFNDVSWYIGYIDRIVGEFVVRR